MAKTRVKNNLHVRKKSRKGRMKVEKLLLQEIPELEKTMEQGYLSMEKAIPHEQPVIDDVARTDGMFTEQISEQKITNIKEFSEEASMERTKKWELSDIKRTEEQEDQSIEKKQKAGESDKRRIEGQENQSIERKQKAGETDKKRAEGREEQSIERKQKAGENGMKRAEGQEDQSIERKQKAGETGMKKTDGVFMEVSKKNIEMEDKQYKISEMSKLVHVEAHVLRYWEEELELPIRRNELGHRYYTSEDLERFIKIKQLKEKGIQLKGIRTMLDLPAEYVVLNENIPDVSTGTLSFSDDKEEKAFRLQLLLKGLVKEAVQESNMKMAEDIKECIVKEMDYQFRVASEEQEQRQMIYNKQQEEYFRQLDEMIQNNLHSRKKRTSLLFRTNKSK